MTWVAQPGMATPGKHYAPVAIAIGAFSAGGEDATRVGYLRSDGLLAAEAILQQDQFGTRAQAPGDLLTACSASYALQVTSKRWIGSSVSGVCALMGQCCESSPSIRVNFCTAL